MGNDTHEKSFSFAESADVHGRKLENIVKEVSVRLPLNDTDHVFYRAEQEAHKALELAPNSPFLVIERVRLLDGLPGAIHRAFLNPLKFPDEFVNIEKEIKLKEGSLFSKEKLGEDGASLIKVYKHYYNLASRDTFLRPRMPSSYEQAIIFAELKELEKLSRDKLEELEGLTKAEELKELEKSKLNSYKKIKHITYEPILDSNQKLYAIDPITGEKFVIEYLKASYLGYWEFEIKDRPPQ